MFDYKRALSPKGIYAMVGGAVPRIYQALLLGLLLSISDRQKFRLVAEGPNKGLSDLKELIEAGKVVPIVDQSFKLSEVPQAFRYFAEGRHKGKLVIAIDR